MRLLALVVLAVALVAPETAAQEPSSGTTTTLGQVPSQDIIPAPGSGESPEDAGDRGGALQIALLVLVLGGVGAAVTLVVRQSRRARGVAQGRSSSRMRSHTARPPRNPSR